MKVLLNKITGQYLIVDTYGIHFDKSDKNKYELVDTDQTDFFGVTLLNGDLLNKLIKDKLKETQTLQNNINIMKRCSHLYSILENKESLSVEEFNTLKQEFISEIINLSIDPSFMDSFLNEVYLTYGFLGE